MRGVNASVKTPYLWDFACHLLLGFASMTAVLIAV